MQEIDFTSTILQHKLCTLAVVAARPGDGNTTVTLEMAFALERYATVPVLTVALSKSDRHLATMLQAQGVKLGRGSLPKDCNRFPGQLLVSNRVQVFTPNIEVVNTINLETQLTAEWVRALKRYYDFVLFDMPPFEQNPGYAMFMQALDGAILTVNCKSSRWGTVRDMKNRLSEAHVNIIGAVLNERSYPVPQAIYSLL